MVACGSAAKTLRVTECRTAIRCATTGLGYSRLLLEQVPCQRRRTAKSLYGRRRRFLRECALFARIPRAGSTSRFQNARRLELGSHPAPHDLGDADEREDRAVIR